MLDPRHIADHCESIRAQLWDRFEAAQIFLYLTKDCISPTILEVGTWLGGSACLLGMIAKAKGGKLICVDKWEECVEIEKGQGDHTYKTFLKNMEEAEVGEVISVIRSSSEDAASIIEDESCDLVWLDADHSYLAVSQDIQLWWPKVKQGGFLSGHDAEFYWSEDEDKRNSIDLNEAYWVGLHGGIPTAVYEAFGDYHSLVTNYNTNIWYIKKGFIPLKGGIR